MKTLKLLKGLAALMGTFTLFFCTNSASADYAVVEAARCETLLRSDELALSALIKNPQELEAERIYRTGSDHLRTVSVDARALKEMDRLDLLTVERLFRSVRKGFVPPLSGPGVVRLTDIHRNLVEVKVVQKSVTRLIGCFQSGHLEVKRVYHKRNGGRSGALQAFADLCG